jgi:hypothetical protein
MSGVETNTQGSSQWSPRTNPRPSDWLRFPMAERSDEQILRGRMEGDETVVKKLLKWLRPDLSLFVARSERSCCV